MIVQYQEGEAFRAVGNPLTKRIGRGRAAENYGRIHCAFDIETSRKDNTSYMYIWQFQIDDITIIGRTWSEFESLVAELNKLDFIIIVWVANLSFEFAFISSHFEISQLFAKESRQPLKFRIKNLEFRDALAISGGSLAQLAKDYTTTQKAVGDLDYNTLRNSKTELTAEEIGYCVNDVIILKEFSQFLWDKYIDKGFIPITKTGILRREVKSNARKWARKRGLAVNNLYNVIKRRFPKTAEQYKFEMEYLFRGGFTHANARYVGEVLTSEESPMLGIDFTSSYPFSMFNRYVPITPFTEIQPKAEYLKKYCCKFIATFTNIKSTTSHSIESKNKCIDYKNAVWDNGRLRRADSVTVFLTELDFESYRQFYDWDDIKIHNFSIARRGYLPTYLLDVLYNNYKAKNDLKKEGKSGTPEYNLAKGGVNSMFGLTCTRLCFADVCYDNGQWSMKKVDKTYDDMISSEVLSPYFGIYITAQSRRNELKTLYDLRDVVAYSDTDSHFLIDETMRPYIEEYNREITKENAKMCERLGYDFNILWDIGQFDYDKVNIQKFCSYGAKRYIYTDSKGIHHQTISGLGKTALIEYAESLGVSPYELFCDNMYIPSDYTHKLRAIYNDEPTSENIDGEEMRESSSVTLVPVEFTMKLSHDYINLLGQLYDRTIRRLS